MGWQDLKTIKLGSYNLQRGNGEVPTLQVPEKDPSEASDLEIPVVN